MEYVKGNPYFCKGERIKQYPYLDRDIETDILIVGGGIVGAIANFYISKKYDTVLVDKSRFGFGCTTCATVLLEYQLDDYAEDLKKYMTEEDIVSIYKMGLDSINEIDNIIKKLGNHCHFSLRPSLMYTTNIFKQNAVQKEYEFRLRHNFKANLIDENNNPFPFKIKKGIYCEDGGAEFNPYLFTKQLIENASNQTNLYEFTEIDRVNKTEYGFIATTNFGNTIKCKKIVFATGYNFEFIKQNLCLRDISYTIVTKPIKNLKLYKNTLVQDDKEPYHYMRILPDKRIIFGGGDNASKGKPISDKTARKKYDKLYKDLVKMLPQYKEDIIVEYEFCGYFGWTDNNLGLIGESETPNIYYMISCGANGVINAIAGARILLDIFENIPNQYIPLFSPTRKI